MDVLEDPEENGLVEFERQRARNIERNKRVLNNLGVNRLPELIESGPGTSTAGTRRETRGATQHDTREASREKREDERDKR